MGNYNPHAPQNLGNEWVGIREEDLTFSPAVNAVEIGHSFTLATPRQIGDARFYINDWPPGNAIGQTFMAAVYPKGQEDNAGPVQRVVIPCNAGGITGGGINYYGGAATLATAFADPSDGTGVSIAYVSGTSSYVRAYFAVSQYSNHLTGKRILGVNVLYALSATTGEIIDTDMVMMIANNAFRGAIYADSEDGTLYGSPEPEFLFTAKNPQQVSRMMTGEINPLWSTTLSPNSTSERQPWDYTGLARFEITASTPQSVYIGMGTNPSSTFTPFVVFDYLALEVFYCEERRLAIGARSFGYDSSNPAKYRTYAIGANTIPMRNASQVINPVLPAADYTVVLSSADQGTFRETVGNIVGATKTPTLNALRELYSITPHPGIEIDLPFPKVPAIVGRTFASETTHVLPQISLHTTGGTPLTEPHAYGRQIPAPVYGSIYVQQYVQASNFATTYYPQVRFWARRFGDTTIPLTFHHWTNPAFSASITPTAFDALPEILDGWKEVDLTFSPSPSFIGGPASAELYQWDATGENIGNRWEILAVSAPAISGVPGNLLATAPSAQQLDTVTYAGALDLLWANPRFGTTVTSDPWSDASLIFAQNMPTVSGFALTLSSQSVSGIGLNCGLPPGCIPSGIPFHTLNWVSLSSYGAASAPVTGFGYYDIQRMDTIDTDWATIAQATSVATTSFRDYEPRVGILSSYRIRACDSYGFCGPWSSTITGTLPSPGVYGVDGNGVLIFTCNERQTGSINLAYTQNWESNGPEEQFDFPESKNVKLQEFYNQDFVTAFRPLERGGERFEATLLVQAAAVSAPVLENVFHSLRDMAWDTVTQICVRNELGDRWFATVIVPDGTVKRNRRMQLARIQVVEVADTPCVVDPSV